MKQKNNTLTYSFLALFMANIINGVLSSLGSTVLSALIGKYIGKTELAVFGMVFPLIMLASSVNALITMGLTPVAARYIGNKKQDRASSVFSISLIAALVIALIFTVIPILFAPQIADMLTSKTTENAEHIKQLCVICLRLLSCNIILIALDGLLTSALLIDNGKLLVTIGSAAMLLTTIGSAFLYIPVLKGGLAGAMILVSVSAVVKIAILLLYFKRKQRVFHFTLKGAKIKELKEVILCGIPQTIQVFTSIAKSVVFNKILLQTVDTSAVAAFTISCSFGKLIAVFSGSATMTTAIFCGMLYKKDKQIPLKNLLKTSLTVSGIMIGIVGFPIMLFAEQSAGLFLEGSEAEVLPMAAWFIRCTVIMLIMQTLCSVMSGIYIGIRQYVINYITEILRNLIFPLSFMIPGVLLAKETGFGLGLAGYNALSLVTFFLVVPLLFKKKLPLDLSSSLTLHPGIPEQSKECGNL